MFFYYIFTKAMTRAYLKFKLNFFFYKNSLSIKFNHTIYMHLFINLYRQLSVRFFKTPTLYSCYTVFYYLLASNILVIALFFFI